MAKAKKEAAPKKRPKPRTEHYQPKTAIKGIFSGVIGVCSGQQQVE